jgi:hypothetical protein
MEDEQESEINAGDNEDNGKDKVEDQPLGVAAGLVLSLEEVHEYGAYLTKSIP